MIYNYILLEEYTISTIDLFLNEFLVKYSPDHDIYEYPLTAGATEFETFDMYEMFSFLCGKKERWFTFYFTVHEALYGVDKGYIFFNEDGSLLLGLNSYDEYSDIIAQNLKDTFKSKYVLPYDETMPPDNAEEFKALYHCHFT